MNPFLIVHRAFRYLAGQFSMGMPRDQYRAHIDARQILLNAEVSILDGENPYCLPSAADLDAAAAEQEVAEKTR